MTFRNAYKLRNEDEIQSKLDKSFWKVISTQEYDMKPNVNKFGHSKFVNIEAVNQNGNLNYFTHEEVQ